MRIGSNTSGTLLAALWLLVPWGARADFTELGDLKEDRAWDRLAVLELAHPGDLSSEWMTTLEAAGGMVRLIAGNIAWVDLPPEAVEAVSNSGGIRSIHRDAWAGPYPSLMEESASRLLAQYRDGSAIDPPAPTSAPLAGDALLLPDAADGQAVCTSDYGQWPPTSDPFLGRTHIMQGRVTANFFLVESDANGPENIFDWDSAEISLATAEIQEALVWWSTVAGIFGHSLSFVLQLHSPSQYECQLPGEASIHDSAWLRTYLLPVAMERMGFPGLPAYCTTGKFNESSIASNDRAFSAFIFDGNNYFTDGHFAYAYLNGPFLVSLRRPDQWGTNYLNVVLQHEMGHIFRACDEYASGCPNCDPCIPNGTPNYNCEIGCGSNAECIMRTDQDDCCGWTRIMIGLLNDYAAPVLVSPIGGQVSPTGVVPLQLTHVFGVPRYQFDLGFEPSVGTSFFSMDTVSNTALTWDLPEGKFYWRARSEDRQANVSLYTAVESLRVDYPPFVPPPDALILTGTERSSSPTWIRLFDAEGTASATSFLAFDGERRGATVAAADLNGDGVDEILASPRELPGTDHGHVRIYQRNADFISELDSLFTFDVEQLELAGGDLDGDGLDEIVAAPKRRTPQTEYIVSVFGADGSLIQELIPFPNGRSGCHVACGDVDNDGVEEILTAEGESSVIRTVRILRLDGSLVAEIEPFPDTGHSGFSVAAADVDGDGAAEIVASSARDEPNANRVRVFRLDGTLVTEFLGHPNQGDRVTLGGGDVDGDGLDEILTGTGPESSDLPEVRIWDGAGGLENQFVAYPVLEGGVNTAVMKNQPTTTAVDLGPDASGNRALVIEALFPNPASRQGAELRFRAPMGSNPQVGVYDVTGRSLRQLDARALEGSRFEARWDGTLSPGIEATAGVYWFRIEAAGNVVSRKLVLLR